MQAVRAAPRWLRLLSLALVLWLIYATLAPGQDFLGYRAFTLERANYDLARGMFSPPWLAILLAPLAALPVRAGLAALLGLTLAGGWFAARTLGGRPLVLLLSAPMFWVLWWGQIDVLPLIALALAALGSSRRSWAMLAAALILAAIKPHVVAVPVLALWWWSPGARLRSMAAAGALLGLSLLAWGNWLPVVFARVLDFARSTTYRPWNATLGPIALPLFIPALFAPLSRSQRLAALTATAMLVSPYMPFYSTLPLLAFPLPWPLLALAFLGYFPNLLGTSLAWNGMVLLPLGMLVWIYLRAARPLPSGNSRRAGFALRPEGQFPGVVGPPPGTVDANSRTQRAPPGR
jgi:hypothetical protein